MEVGASFEKCASASLRHMQQGGSLLPPWVAKTEIVAENVSFSEGRGTENSRFSYIMDNFELSR